MTIDAAVSRRRDLAIAVILVLAVLANLLCRLACRRRTGIPKLHRPQSLVYKPSNPQTVHREQELRENTLRTTKYYFHTAQIRGHICLNNDLCFGISFMKPLLKFPVNTFSIKVVVASLARAGGDKGLGAPSVRYLL